MDENTYAMLRPLFRIVIERTGSVEVREIVAQVVDAYIDDESLDALANVMPYFVRYLDEYPHPLLVSSRRDSGEDQGLLSPTPIDYQARRSEARRSSAASFVPKDNGWHLVAWAPPETAAPIELVAAMVPAGGLTEREWLERLADRVSEMAVAAGPESVAEAARILELPEPDEPSEAGQFFVIGNLNLRTHLTLAMNGDPFPATASEDEEAARAIKETDFWTWVDLAAAMVSASSLD